MRLYVYCLSEENVAEALENITAVAEAKPHLISRGAIRAVVSDFGDEPIRVTRENVIAHEQVIDRVLAQTTPLPFRFGTVVTAIELRNYISSRREQLEALLARVRGAVEMSVKIMWDKNAVAARKVEVATIQDGSDQSLGPGRAFLLARQRALAGDETLKRRAEEIALWLDERLSDVAREAVLSVQPTEALVVRASYLVERTRLDLYRERIKRAREERAELNFLTSGAWAPYSFTTFHSRNL